SLFPLFNSRANYDTGKFARFYLMIFYSAVAGIYLAQLKRKDIVAWWLAYASLILSALILITNWGSLDSSRFGQGIGNPVWIARMSGIYLIYVAFKQLRGDLSFREMLFGVIALILMVLTGSRAPILSLAIVWVVFSLIQKKNPSKKIISLFLL